MQFWFSLECFVQTNDNSPVTKDNDENMTTKNDVEYLSALAKCGNASLVSRYRRMHCAKRNHAGNIATIGRIKYEPSTQDSTSKMGQRTDFRCYQLFKSIFKKKYYQLVMQFPGLDYYNRNRLKIVNLRRQEQCCLIGQQQRNQRSQRNKMALKIFAIVREWSRNALHAEMFWLD